MKKKFMSFINDFKAFAMRGNVLDLAVGVIIGGAFGKITTSLVNDIIMPFIGLLIGGINFKDWKYQLPTTYELAPDQSPPAVNIGLFIQSVVDFLIIAFCVFIMIRIMTKLTNKEEAKPEEPAAPPEPDEQTLLLREIRDLMKR